MTRVTGTWVRAPDLQSLFACFADAGYNIFAVGGCVRNDVMGRDLTDVDLATDATPDIATKLAQKAGYKALPTGFDHGTITVVTPTEPYEITTFRTDVVTDGRHAEVAFSKDMMSDAQRRDFTMNALYCDAEGTVFDPLGGLDDLIAGRVRFIGAADQRIQEDYLRILRFFRFTAIYGDPELGIDADGLAACSAYAEGLDGVSKERIGAEIIKTLTAPDPAPALAAMQASGVLHRILPGADTKCLALLVDLEGDRPIDPLRRLVLMGGSDLQENLRLSNAQSKTIETLRNSLQESPQHIAYKNGYDMAISAVILQSALFETPVSAEIESILTHAAAQTFPIVAADLMPDFQGAALGRILKLAETTWINSDFKMDKAELIEWCLTQKASDAN